MQEEPQEVQETQEPEVQAPNPYEVYEQAKALIARAEQDPALRAILQTGLPQQAQQVQQVVAKSKYETELAQIQERHQQLQAKLDKGEQLTHEEAREYNRITYRRDMLPDLIDIEKQTQSAVQAAQTQSALVAQAPQVIDYYVQNFPVPRENWERFGVTEQVLRSVMDQGLRNLAQNNQLHLLNDPNAVNGLLSLAWTEATKLSLQPPKAVRDTPATGRTPPAKQPAKKEEDPYAVRDLDW